MKFYVFVAILTAAVTFVLAWLVWRFALRYKLYPEIRERDVHRTPTPRLGGVAMFFGVLAAFGLSSVVPYFAIFWDNPARNWALLGATFLIVVVGVVDDLWDLDWFLKLGAQFLAAWLVVGPGGIQILYLPIGGITVVSSWISLTVSILSIVVVMNAVNFIDGLDGLVAGVCLIANAVFFAYTYLVARDFAFSSYSSLAAFIAVVLMAACAGFLPFNWSPAKMFMGDAGALMLGLLMASAAILVTSSGYLPPQLLADNDVFGRSQLLGAFIPIILPIVIVLLPLLDFAMAVIRRVGQGRSPFSPDRKHLHHRMLDMGHSDRDAVLIFYSWTAVVSLAVLLMYIGTTENWPGLYIPGAVFLLVGVIACATVTLLPSRRPAAPPKVTA
ncbi:undecaprenyl/decaprenyl-phosphate alpha-N-acetylglucosaminyl 1-phosphate transferase [Microbacterium sp. W1N]|uniref:MraY family glycosyltransferase n=1 Tax=Microbacterium festucae TaxID=2977531 RepID=UPI0021BEB4C4|nr:MraY family glycosyltransferase [Microbacterium festucae]MCT9821603.1 undecaprenyl/decaprenyl-phosphate alpha-N-acetylglucosaminyl 1-phosphate transferase [Microbacterium festucae]